PENINFGFWPEQPLGPFASHIGVDYRASRLFQNAAPERNPERKTVWSRMYLDGTKHAALVSLSTPVYDKERFLGVIAHDITLTELLERTVNVPLPGTYNLIVAKDGSLIAHPTLTSKIESTFGKLNVTSSGDPELKAIYEAALTVPGDYGVLE